MSYRQGACFAWRFSGQERIDALINAHTPPMTSTIPSHSVLKTWRNLWGNRTRRILPSLKCSASLRINPNLSQALHEMTQLMHIEMAITRNCLQSTRKLSTWSLAKCSLTPTMTLQILQGRKRLPFSFCLKMQQLRWRRIIYLQRSRPEFWNLQNGDQVSPILWTCCRIRGCRSVVSNGI